MIRKIIKIDQETCNGCGACAAACHEGAIEMVDGKATLARESYCDGLGDCLPECPTGAIRFEEREAPAYDEAAVLASKHKKAQEHTNSACPGSRMRQMQREDVPSSAGTLPSQLRQWPCQIKLLPINAPYFAGADLLIAANCTAFAYANIHADYMKGRITLIGCPKLDGVDYSEKLTAILRQNEIRSVTVLRMEVPCCGGLAMAAKKAVQDSGKTLPFQVVTVSIDGTVLNAYETSEQRRHRARRLFLMHKEGSLRI